MKEISQSFKREKIVNSLANKNLKLMQRYDSGNMLSLLSVGSIGRFADDGRSCAVANFYVNQYSGIIKYFGNSQNVPEEIRFDYTLSSFLVAIDSKKGRLEIIDQETISPYYFIKEVLDESVKKFNSKRIVL